MRERLRRWRRVVDVLFLDGFRAAPGYMTLFALLVVVGSAASTCYPLGYRLLVDGALRHERGTVLEGAFLVGGLLAVGWLVTALGATESMALGDRIALWRTSRLVELISGVPGLEHLERPDYLGNVERINTNRRQLAAAPRQLLRTVAGGARIVVLLVLLGEIDPWLLLLPLAAVPPLVAERIAKRITRRAEDGVADDRRLASALFALATDVEGAAELRCYGLGPHLAAEHRRLSDRLDRQAGRQAAAVLAVQAAGWFLYAALLMGAVAYVVVRAVDGGLSLGTVLEAVSLIRRSRTQLAQSAQTSGALVSTLATVDRLFWLEDHAAAAAVAAGRSAPPAVLRSGIRLSGVSFRYPGTDREVLSGLDLTLPAGATVALVGENGAGKTTLAKLLLGMYAPSAGTITVDGVALTSLDPASWRERTTAAFQDFSRLHLPVVESIGVAELSSLDAEEPARLALVRAGADDLEPALPSGLATAVGTAYTGGHGLSGGQWQKIALARALRRDSSLLVVLDEPTASLDAGAEHALFTRYASLAASAADRTGAVTLLVSHRFSTVRTADLIVVLDGGRAVEVGTHADLLAAGGTYAEYFRLQSAAYR